MAARIACDKVQRKSDGSYAFPGVVIATGLKLDGTTWHCEVECIIPGVTGCTHVFPATSLREMDPIWETFAAWTPNADNAWNEAIEAAAKEAEAWFPANTGMTYPAGGVVPAIRAMKRAAP